MFADILVALALGLLALIAAVICNYTGGNNI